MTAALADITNDEALYAKIKGLLYMIALRRSAPCLHSTRHCGRAAAPRWKINIPPASIPHIIASVFTFVYAQTAAGVLMLGTKIGCVVWLHQGRVQANCAGSWGGSGGYRGAVSCQREAAMILSAVWQSHSERFPAKERSIAVGYFNVGSLAR